MGTSGSGVGVDVGSCVGCSSAEYVSPPSVSSSNAPASQTLPEGYGLETPR
ncbi:MAG: hypothetical protein P8Z42_08265 [Anaerolineales bacterium]